MTAATDALARARAELYAAEEMGSPEVDVAQAAVEQAEETVRVEDEDASRYALTLRGNDGPEDETFGLQALRSNLDDERYFSQY